MTAPDAVIRALTAGLDSARQGSPASLSVEAYGPALASARRAQGLALGTGDQVLVARQGLLVFIVCKAG